MKFALENGISLSENRTQHVNSRFSFQGDATGKHRLDREGGVETGKAASRRHCAVKMPF